MSFDWAPVIQAGIQIAGGFLQDERDDEKRSFDRETTILNLQDNERDRANRLEMQQLALQGSKYAADTSLAAAKKRIMGDVLLQQGQGQEKLGIEAFRAIKNTPERFNTAANALAAILSR